jgi:RNA-directed DNA polymerase
MTTVNPMDGWDTLPWKQFERQTFKLQTRIYRASQRGDVKTVHRLQRLLMKSWAAKCLAVRRVSQDNQGKKTAGVDGVKLITPPQRLQLARSLRLSENTQPLRRVWIPKPSSGELRALGIPTLGERARQGLVKLALEPEWEAQFEPNSYGFRPGRSTHDAIEAIFGSIRLKAKYVLDADITKCFDRISHQALLNKLRTFPGLRRVIRGWLRAGVMEGHELFPTTQGTPQGGVISPLLANVALHGLESHIRASFPESVRRQEHWKPFVVRYADDLVVLHQNEAVIEEVRQITQTWLAEMGLELNPNKTRIAHTLNVLNGKRGFDFLGFYVRQHRVGKTHAAKVARHGHDSLSLGFKTIITPSNEALRRHARDLGDVVHRFRAGRQEFLIERLNPIIKGWSRYYSTVIAKDALADMDHVLFSQLRSWARSRHKHKARFWVISRYWHREGSRRWVFRASVGPRLVNHDETPIRRHTKVRGGKSPLDGDWVYWASRLGKHPDLPHRVAVLLRQQQGRCARCGLYFRGDDQPEVDHIVPRSLGGRDSYDNWQLLHRHCHDEKTGKVDCLSRQ